MNEKKSEDISWESGYATKGRSAAESTLTSSEQIAIQSSHSTDQGTVEETNDSSHILTVSGTDQTLEENEPAIAMWGRTLSEATSELNGGGGESMVLESVQEDTVIEVQQESAQEESSTGSSQPSENVLPRTTPPTGSDVSNLVTGDKNRLTMSIPANIEKSKKICDAVSKYFIGQFMSQWKEKTRQESSTIKVIAALLMEKKNKMKVVVLTAGTKVKTECSYYTRKSPDDVEEAWWGICDGHAEAVCYRLANLYFMTELCKLYQDGDSIFDKSDEGYMLKRNVKFHLFTTHPPCGFMAKEECHLLSWKRPFKRKPHTLQCSSKILIGSYLGIQGSLSHWLVKPLYISSITIPRYESVPTLHSTYIMERFDQFRSKFYKMFHPSGEKGGYHFQMPHVEIVDVDLQKLFPECFRSYINEKPFNVDSCSSQLPQQETTMVVKPTTKGSKRIVCVTPAVDENAGIFTMAFTLEDGVGSDECSKRLANLDKKMKLSVELKQSRLQALQEAQVRLSQALNVREALLAQRKIIIQEMEEKYVQRCQKVDKIIEELKKAKERKTEVDDLEAQVSQLTESIGNILKENQIKSVVDAIPHNLEYQLMLNDLESLQEMKETDGIDQQQLYSDLMCCDYARCVEAIRNNINNAVTY